MDLNLNRLMAAPNWSNGRDLETLGKMVFQEAASADSEFITADMFRNAVDRCLENKREPGNMPYELSLIHISEPTRLLSISYAVFCLKKKKNNYQSYPIHNINI
eukprot:TRINITY_DN48141_c0_g1_i1.p1 TRINITY_DN48141_c0_g1~~TRINITY_DN48141_c0_g1_i1.p1  ORF type:complete len:104 (-),score=12.06 TRINITY_DN48141_c0_g1_i1:4-315(-)